MKNHVSKQDLKSWVAWVGKMAEINRQSVTEVNFRIDHAMIFVVFRWERSISIDGTLRAGAIRSGGWWAGLDYWPNGRSHSATGVRFRVMHDETLQEAVNKLCEEIENTTIITG